MTEPSSSPGDCPWGVPVTSIPWVRWETMTEPQAVSLTPRYLEPGRHQRDEIAALQAHRCRLLSQGKAVATEMGRDRMRARCQKMWVVEKPDLNAWRRASWDAWSIYSLREDTLLKSEPKKSPRRNDKHPKSAIVIDSQLIKEKRCILETPIKNPSKLERKRFSKVILQKYHTPSKASSHSYCTPQDALSASLARGPTLTELIQKSKGPPEIPVNPRKQTPVTSSHVSIMQHQFCETLGASSCRSCIEETNRKIAREIEQSSFPALECSASTLVAPTLARMMTQSSLTSSPSRGSRRRARTGCDVSRGRKGSAVSLERKGSGTSQKSKGSDVIVERRESDVILPPVSRNEGRKSALSVHEHAAEVRRDKLREASKSPGGFGS